MIYWVDISHKFDLIYQVRIIPVNFWAVWSISAIKFGSWVKIFARPVFIYLFWFGRMGKSLYDVDTMRQVHRNLPGVIGYSMRCPRHQEGAGYKYTILLLLVTKNNNWWFHCKEWQTKVSQWMSPVSPVFLTVGTVRMALKFN